MNETETDTALLASVPDQLVITTMLKAHVAEENGHRFVYVEASNEALDAQNEVVMCKALEESADYFKRYGNLDLDHYTQIGARSGVPDYELYEIGRPVDVRIDGRKTFVKGQIYEGEGPVAAKANYFWQSLTQLRPPKRWYPSVGGSVLGKSIEIDPQTKTKRAFVNRVRWTNLGFSLTPVNQAVPPAQVVPFGVLAKCWGAAGLDYSKALEAGYGTDSGQLTGAGALRRQDLHGSPLSYFDFRERIAEQVRKKRIANPTGAAIHKHATSHLGLDDDQAAEWTERFMHDLARGLKQRRTQ